ncbi:MAG: hypothetical protein ACTHM9_10605, partial [Gemmatimonadales bacterium]
LLVLSACGHAPTPKPGPAPARRSSACVIATDSVGPARPIVAAYGDPDDARRGLLAATRVAPLRRDCEGRVLPGLAVRWSTDTAGRFWTLTLDSSLASAPDSSPRWTAGNVAAAWRADSDAATALRSAGVTSLVPLDERRLVVGFTASSRTVPAVFADRALGVSLPGPSDLVDTEPVGGDLRDAVDRGADLIVTDDAGLLDYAARRPAVTIMPLPWDRTYVLVLPAASAALAAVVPADTASFRAGLARDAVRVEARPAAGGAMSCAGSGAMSSGNGSNLVAFSNDDRTARALAERLVALAHSAELQVRALPAGGLTRALARGEAQGFVAASPSPATCAAWPGGGTVMPLIETRRHAIVRRGAPLLVVDGDGVLRPAEPVDTAGTP